MGNEGAVRVAMMRAKRVSVVKCVLWFGVVGGAGVPGLYLGVWNAVLWIGIDRLEAVFPRAMVWIEAVRLMFWPFSIFLLGIGDSATKAFIEAILLNMLLYGMIGALVWISLGHRLAEWMLAGASLLGLYAVNSSLVSHPASFAFAAVILFLFFTLFYWRFG
jgi:hypothetical protein